jgi:GTP-binding protein YchF
MQLGIIGLPQSGKTTLYKALTKADVSTEMSSGQMEVHTSVVDVPDPRVDQLAAIYKPKKIVRTKVTYADIAGLDGSKSKDGLPGALINQLAQMDGFLHVVRQFESPVVPHLSGSVDAIRDVNVMDTEFILNDLIMVERRLERLQEEHRRGVARPREQVAAEIEIFERLQAMLAQEKPLRHYQFSSEEERVLASFGFLSRKPQIVVINQSEEQEALDYTSPHPQTQVISLPAKLEMDIAALPEEDAQIFMEEFGITETSLERLIRLSYNLLGLQTFFTAGEKEVHAWTLRRGGTAKEAAGVIHSDFEKGFIRAEIVSFEDMIQYGGTAEARNKGRLRVEGKNYLMADGDIIEVRFNI